jgi:predicted AlkP superfamily pyrophosphatase or phosphodiesterase
VVIDWMGPLDSAQHQHGVGSPEAREALRQIDRSLSQTLAALDRPGVSNRTNVIVTSDHGFAHHADGVNVTEALIAAGLKQGRESTEVVVASQSQSVLFYVAGRAPASVERLVRFLQQQPWVDVIFTRGGRDGQGSVTGTFSLDLVRASHPARGADVVASLSWTSQPNAFGAPGTHTVVSAATGPLKGAASGHGGLNPWVVRNTFVAWGPRFSKGRRLDAPVSPADVAPTVLTLIGIEPDAGAGRGRVLRELLSDGPSPESLNVAKRTIRTSAGPYRATLDISTVAGHDYVDGGARQR